jgi:hypothetical protein
MIRLIHIKNSVSGMDDAIANHYSQAHQSGGYYKKMGAKTNYAIPIKNQAPESYLSKESGKNATRKSEDFGRLASQTKKAQKLRKRRSSDDSDDEGKRVVNRKKKKLSKYKRSKIDEALGSDTY